MSFDWKAGRRRPRRLWPHHRHRPLLLRAISISITIIALFLAPTTVSAMTTSSSSSSSLLGLQGQRVLVTGGGRGIGRAIALICQKQGAHVAVASRTASQLEETVALASSSSSLSLASLASETEDDSACTAAAAAPAPPNRMLALPCDVTDPADVESMVRTIVEEWGGLDILINNAGGAQSTKGTVASLSSDPQELMQLLQLNVVSAHIVTSTVLRLAMTPPKDGGGNGNGNGGGGGGGGGNGQQQQQQQQQHILNVSSKAGKVGLSNRSFYVASKFALEGLTATWAKELEDRDIVVNSISPGMVDTQSFPKKAPPPGRKGVRSAESIEDALMMALTAPRKFSGHYIHVDELDMVRKCELPDWAAWKQIDEEPMEEFLPPADF